MKQNFLDYVKEKFSFSDEEINEFIEALEKPLKKSIRINTNKISVEDFKALVEPKWWILTPSGFWKNMFYIDRSKDLNIALGSTLEHISGLFYVQEVAASSSPFYMSGDKKDEGEYLILDASASPWWKTTWLAEYYPNSAIVANEFDKPRIKQLFTNLERMWALNVWVTNYDWRFFKWVEETFDKILLDAPCSGEWTCFKWTDAVKYWNIKNIKSIAKLQFGLLESALKALKIGGEVVFSTCTINKIENEGVMEKIIKKYPDQIEIIPVEENSIYKRLWPHRDKTGGFFIAKIKKIDRIENKREPKPLADNKNTIQRISRKEEKLVMNFVEERFWINLEKYIFYKHHDEVYITNANFNDIIDKLFFFKIGQKIGIIENWNFIPDFNLGTTFKLEKNVYNIENEEELDRYLKGYDLKNNSLEDWYYWVKFAELNAGMIEVRGEIIKNLIPTKHVRK